jgi:hypothetical protein
MLRDEIVQIGDSKLHIVDNEAAPLLLHNSAILDAAEWMCAVNGRISLHAYLPGYTTIDREDCFTSIH